METVTKCGNELKVGDSIEVWWCREDRGQKRNPKNGNPVDIITAIVPYQGPLNRTCFTHGARIATFLCCRVGMTIPNDETYAVIKQ